MRLGFGPRVGVLVRVRVRVRAFRVRVAGKHVALLEVDVARMQREALRVVRVPG